MFKNYNEAAEYLAAGRDKTDRPYPSVRSTRVQTREDGGIAVMYHDTDVVTLYPNRVVFDSGGWRTVTTKARMNDVLRAMGAGSIYQEAGVWYYTQGWRWDDEKSTHVYNDGLTIDYTGDILSDVDSSEAEEIEHRVKLINAYKRAIKQGIIDKTIPAPSGGDCWYCLMHDESGKSLGDLTGDVNHLISHLEVGYIVPSLIMNAITDENVPTSIALRDGVVRYFRSAGQDAGLWAGREWFADNVARAVAIYLKQRLGIAR